MKLQHKIAALGMLIGVVVGGFEVWDHLRAEMDRTRAAAVWRLSIEERICSLEGGRIWRGDCVHRNRRR
jgi:hypothetical protein